MKEKLRRKLLQRKRQLEKRIAKQNWSGQSPMLAPPSIQYELSDRIQAVSAGGLGLVQGLVKRLDVAGSINRECKIFKLHLPYTEADHVLNIAYNLLAGGTRLEHLEARRTDEAYLNAVGAERIPDPTTAGDFCRRFANWDCFWLQEAFHSPRVQVWREQKDEFFDEAIIEADGTMVETYGEHKQGIGINHKGQWGYHPLVVTLANTREVLYVVNRSGNRPSHEGASVYFDRAIELCRSSGFRRITLRGDTDFSQTAHLDDWHSRGVRFVFGMDAHHKLTALADNLPESAWQKLKRQKVTNSATRARRPNFKEAIVVQNEYENKIQEQEWVAEFNYQPHLCHHQYRLVVVRKHIAVMKGQQKLFDDSPYFFYITNISSDEQSPEEIVFQANDRCDQENILSSLHQMGALAAPLDNLNSNWAYMCIATLAWNLKAWLGLTVSETGTVAAKSKRRAEKKRILRMDFSTFRQAFINIPAQIIRSGRRLIYRLLTWTPNLEILFRLQDDILSPLRC